MNSKGFSLVELLGSLVILGLILGIGLYNARGTLSTTLSTLNGISENEIYDAAEMYVIEYSASWNNNGEEYACLTVNDLVDVGYFDYDKVMSYKDIKIKVVRDVSTKVISSVKLVDVCE